MTEQSIDQVGGGVPADPAGQPFATPDELSSDPPTLATQIAATDAALRAWRDESVRRRVAWETEQEELRRARRAWQNRMLRRTAIAGGTGGLVGLAIAVVGFVSTPTPQAVEEVVAPPPAIVEAAPPEPVVEPAPPPVEVVASPAVAVVPGSASTWAEAGHQWVKFEVNERALVEIAWRDGAGVPVLEPMRCGPPNGDGIRVCLAGRSDARITRALETGAAPGTWTVEACGPAGCTLATTFNVP
jgi:hypothetical protein